MNASVSAITWIRSPMLKFDEILRSSSLISSVISSCPSLYDFVTFSVNSLLYSVGGTS